MAEFPKKANVVIVGLGGIVGASVAHHLIERGWNDIVGIDKSAIPTDIGSTAHASDFCFNTMHDNLTIFTTKYSIDFFEAMGRYERVGGLEVARIDDDERMDELKRRVSSGKAFGNRVKMITPKEAKELFPLLEEDQIQGALYDPDAGLVVPRSQTVAGELVDSALSTGKLTSYTNTPCTDLVIKDGKIKGVVTPKGTIAAEHVVICSGLWGRLHAEMVDEDLPIMPVDHPLSFFKPFDEFAGTGKEIGYPLLRDQGNSAYLRDTGDPKSAEGGQIEWGYYEENEPRMCHPRDILEKEQARLSPSQRDLEIEEIIEPLEKAMELTPILGELGYDEKYSFNGLLQVTSDGGPSLGESQKARGLWYAVAVWVKDGPGVGKLIADWMTDGYTHIDHNSVDYARFYPHNLKEDFIEGRCNETARKIYNPPVHPREPFANGRNVRKSPYYEREKELGGYFMELGGWERAHGYASNEHLLEKYGDKVPVREHEWDNRHFWRVSNAEHLALSENVGMINLSHFAVYDVEGEGAEDLLEYLSVAKIGGENKIGKGIYTHFLDINGGIRSDLTILNLAKNHLRVIDGADAGNRDFVYMKRMAEDLGYDNVNVTDRTEDICCLGVWGPNARTTLQKIADNPAELEADTFPFASIKDITIAGVKVKAFRISYVGEQGWELHFNYNDGLALWDAVYAAGAIPIGVETYANTRRMEKSLRLQNADLLTEYNLIEADLARPKVKSDNFHGKDAYMAIREKPEQSAYLCTVIITNNTDKAGIKRYPVGNLPVLDPKTNDVIIDDINRRSFISSIAYGPTIGRNIGLCYLPPSHAKVGQKLVVEYFDEPFEAEVAGVGYAPLYDPDNAKPRS